MGKIDSRKLDNGMVELEITYGGNDAPFGGMDTSAPPMYIDPACFSFAGNFVVANNQLVAAGWHDLGISLASWGSNKFLGAGKFYTNQEYYNWVLGYTSNTSAGTPPTTTVVYSIWVFEGLPTGSPIPMTFQLAVPQTSATTAATAATAKLAVNPGYTDIVCPSWDTIYMTIGAAQYAFQYLCPGSAGPAPSTPTGLATYIANVINTNATTNGAAKPCNAVVETDGLTIDLTTIATGTAANATNISISIYSPTNSSKGLSIEQPFQGATDPTAQNFGIPIDPLSWTQVGETLYFGGPGTMILQFSYPQEVPQFSITTQYLGAVTLAKFNNQLIAGGIVPGPGQIIQNPEMIVGWSAPSIFTQWNPVDGTGKVTGAGFNQISDISDYISGVYIGNNILVILRSFGVDYMNALQNAVIPFDFNHISNALVGEGCQDSRLATQFDQICCFIGNTDVFQYSGQLSPIGTKIKSTILWDVVHAPVYRSSTVCPSMFAREINSFGFFLIDYKIYIYCFNNQTWTVNVFQQLAGQPNAIAVHRFVGIDSAPGYWQFQNNPFPCLVTDNMRFFVFADEIQSSDLPNASASTVIFKQEEIMMGRDITIDSLYINIAGTPGQSMTWSVSGVLSSTFTLPSGASPVVMAGYQIFFTEQIRTVKNPQLRLDIPLNPAGTYNQLRIGKIAMFGSFDPNQRPT